MRIMAWIALPTIPVWRWKRWTGLPECIRHVMRAVKGTTRKPMKKLLAELEGKENRKAQFRTAICLIEGGEKHLFEGIVKGEIIREKKGSSGFGYDPVFVPEGYAGTFAEMGAEEKNRISHRARAVQRLCDYLNSK